MSEYIEISCVDQFDDINQAVGWQTEYRQLHRGPFLGRFSVYGSPSSLLTRELVTGPLEVHAEIPDETVSILITTTPTGDLRFNGLPMEGDAMLLVTEGSELHSINTTEAGAYTLRLPASVLDEIARSFEPDWAGLSSGQSIKIKLTPAQLEMIRCCIDEIIDDRLGSHAVQAEWLPLLFDNIIELVVENSHTGFSTVGQFSSVNKLALQPALAFYQCELKYSNAHGRYLPCGASKSTDLATTILE